MLCIVAELWACLHAREATEFRPQLSEESSITRSAELSTVNLELGVNVAALRCQRPRVSLCLCSVVDINANDNVCCVISRVSSLLKHCCEPHVLI